MIVEICAVNKPEDWLQMIAKQFGKAIVNNAFTLPSSVGKGFYKQYYLFPGLIITYVQFTSNIPLKLVRHSVEKSDWIPIMFYTNEYPHEQIIAEETKTVGIDTPDGIFMPSCHIPTEWNLPDSRNYSNVIITFNQNWITSKKSFNDTYITKLLSSDKAFFVFESITSEMQRILDDIKRLIENESSFFEIKLHSKSVELVTLFFDKLEKRTSPKHPSNLKANDVQTVFRIRQRIIQDLYNTPSIANLAQEANMSSSKLQRCFKQVVGKTISEYAQEEKMELAKKLLSTQLYTVSEVGYMIGYSNLSHFTKYFRKYHKINPKEYLISL